ncbi:MAG: hypothetical protein IPM17_13585 [Verrucomicrobia bacterium]|nr:hypothetical protein [Verrucomicrobiota bacterium]
MALTNNVVDRVPFSVGDGSDTTRFTYARNGLLGLGVSGFRSSNAQVGRAILLPRT